MHLSGVQAMTWLLVWYALGWVVVGCAAESGEVTLLDFLFAMILAPVVIALHAVNYLLRRIVHYLKASDDIVLWRKP